MPFRFVHTADIHLDSPLRSLALKDPALSELVGDATRQAFSAIIDLCLDEQVDALLIAGDLYDGEQTSMKTALFLGREIGRLHASGIKTYIIRGNHDAASKITRELVFPESVTVFGGRAGVVETGSPALPVAIHGLSFRDTTAPESLLPHYKSPVPGAINIGLMHTSLNGSAGHDPYAPCTLADLDQSGFRYWALGHIHRRLVHEGRATVVMPGIPQGRDINESGPKSASIVTVTDDGSIVVEERRTHVARFERLPIDLGAAGDWRDIDRLLRDSIARTKTGGSEQLILRLRLSGTTAHAWRIRRDIDLLTETARLAAEAVGHVSIEDVDTVCRPPEIKAQASGDPVDELDRLIRSTILPGDGFQGSAARLWSDMQRTLPPDLRGLLGQNAEAEAEALAQLAADGVDEVLARLRDDTDREG